MAGRCLAKGRLPSLTTSRQKLLWVKGGNYIPKQDSQLWHCSWNWSSMVWLSSSLSCTVNLQLQGKFVSISLKPTLRIVADYVMAQYGHHVVNFSNWGFSIYKTAHRICLRILSITLEKELKFLDYTLWLHYYYLASIDCFFLFLYFLISLIKLILWLKFLHRQRQAEDKSGPITQAQWVLTHFSLT